MKSSVKILVPATLLVLSIFGYALAADKDSPIVTVTVSAANELAMTGGNVTLTINTATSGSDPSDAVDNTSTDLSWTTNQANEKTSAASNLASPNFSLRVLALNITGGTAASEVTLSTTAADFATRAATTTSTPSPIPLQTRSRGWLEGGSGEVKVKDPPSSFNKQQNENSS